MAHAHGTDLGGIRTLEDLRARCVIDEDTGCWHWRLAMSQGSPRVHLTHPATGKTVMRGRRAALLLATGRDLSRGTFAFAKTCCRSDDCVNPAHCRAGTRAEHGEWLSRSGKIKGLPSKSAASRCMWDARGRKISPEAAAIRASSDSQAALARQYGVSHYTIWQIRQGRTHQPTMRGSSVFNWMP